MSSQTKIKHRIQPDLLITAEAVALDLPSASVVTRMGAGIIDAGFTIALIIIIFPVATELLQPDNLAYREAIGISTTVSVFLILPSCIEFFTKGRSLGKLALGLQVLREDGGPVRFRQCVIRQLVGLLELWITTGALALIMATVSRRNKRLGDTLAGTYVIHLPAVRTHLPLVMPPALVSWAQNAQVSEIPAGLTISCRQFLLNNSQMEASHRGITARNLAAQLEEYAFPPCPWGTDPEHFIAAVIVSRRDHEYAAILAGEQAFQRMENHHGGTVFGLQ